MLPLLVLAFIIVPIAELAVLLAIGRQIGWQWTVAALLGAAVLGSVLVRWQGRMAWHRFTEALRTGRPPAREVVDGALVLFGGALLLTPGFLTDILGISLLLPPSRAVVRRLLARRLVLRMATSITARPRGGPPRPARQSYDVDGSAVDVDRPEPGRR